MKILFTIYLLIYFIEFCEPKKPGLQKAASQLLENEGDSKTIDNCKSFTDESIKKLRLRETNVDLWACCLKSLKKNPENGWVWVELGNYYQTHDELSKANICFKQAARLMGKVSQFIKLWHILGPFSIGKPELDGDPIENWGGIFNVSRQRYLKTKYYSELAKEGKINWIIIQQKSPGDDIQISPQINWNDLVSSLGSIAITEWQGWAVGEFAINSKEEVNLLVQCLGVHTFYVNEQIFPGDVYRREQYWFSISLAQGIHTLYVKLRAKGQVVFRCKIKLLTDSVSIEVHSPLALPDLVDGRLLGDMFALPLTNLHSTQWISNIRIKCLHEDFDVKLERILEQIKIPPGQTLSLPVNILQKKEAKKSVKCSNIQLSLKIYTSGGNVNREISLRCREKDQSFTFTFLDHDGSVQSAAAIFPLEGCPHKSCPVLLTLHGTGVSAQNQADSYKRMIANKWIFGVEHLWLLAPTRHGAHNWEGPGALTSMTALEKLEKLTKKEAWIEEKADSSRVVFAGHSMGGHGAWHLATHYPDRAIALVSLAGWIKKEEYGDSNAFFRHDISTSYVDPLVKYIMEACIAENNVDLHISNIKHVPVLTRIGANDRTVHPYFVRRMYRLLKETGANVSYSELPGKEHWWWDTWETNDGGAVNDPEIRKFSIEHASKPIYPRESCSQNNQACLKDFTSGINKYAKNRSIPPIIKQTLTVINPASVESLYGIKIIQQTIVFRTSKIEIEFEEQVLLLKTTNVDKFSVNISSPMLGMKVLKIDSLKFVDNNWAKFNVTVTFCLSKETKFWKICNQEMLGNDQRGPRTLGPARRVAESKFIIVVGSQSFKVSNFLPLAAYIANLFFLTSDTFSPILMDSDIKDDAYLDYNFILLGTPMENSLTKRLLDQSTNKKFDLSFNSEGFKVANCFFNDPQTGLMALLPYRKNTLSLILAANSLRALKDVILLAGPTIPPMTRSPYSNMLPDFVITGPDLQAKGPGGFSCIGFWTNDWKYSPITSSCIC